MKKLKIFLLLSMLLCFGFTLSPEVHAQGGGPNIIEVGVVLPATTQLRLIIDFNNMGPDDVIIFETTDGYIYGTAELTLIGDSYLTVNDIDITLTSTENNIHIYDIDTSTLTIVQRTVTEVYSYGATNGYWTWEDLNAPQTPSGPKPFEIGDELPAGYIKISWDFTGKFTDIFDQDVAFWIDGDGDPENNLYILIEVWDYGEEVRFTINQEEFHIDTPGETVLSIPIPYTIIDIDNSRDYDYYESIGDALIWEVVTEEEFIYDQAYQEGYSDGYSLGRKHARELYGWYDSRTDEWLTVSEYIFRYGTDKPGQSDFYNNFDKYFIPSMIIVFGGAIVLTILKVFKGRE